MAIKPLIPPNTDIKARPAIARYKYKAISSDFIINHLTNTMKTTFLTLALIPAAFAAQGIKLYNQVQANSADENRLYAVVDNNDGCSNACDGDRRHVFFEVPNWGEGAQFARFTDPRSNGDTWLNIHGEDGSDSTWQVFYEGGNGEPIGWCQKTGDVSCECGDGVTHKAWAFAWCNMYQ